MRALVLLLLKCMADVNAAIEYVGEFTEDMAPMVRLDPQGNDHPWP